jgi:hypothetical protein
VTQRHEARQGLGLLAMWGRGAVVRKYIYFFLGFGLEMIIILKAPGVIFLKSIDSNLMDNQYQYYLYKYQYNDYSRFCNIIKKDIIGEKT